MLNTVQRKWLYLEPIFNRKALPSHTQMFGQADQRLRNLLQQLALSKKVISLNQPGQLELLSSLNGTLDACQKALNDYLQDKRERFPRFYFLGDEDLLELLGHPADLAVVGRHLRKLFAAVARVQGGSRQVDSFASLEGETVSMRPVEVT